MTNSNHHNELSHNGRTDTVYQKITTYPGIITEVKAVRENALFPMAVTPLTLNSRPHTARYNIDTEIYNKNILSTHSEIVADFSFEQSTKAPPPMVCTVLDDEQQQFITKYRITNERTRYASL